MTHLTEWIINQVAEDELRGPERAEAEAHLRVCAGCRAAVEETRELFASLAALSAFDPSPGFADAVMAGVRIRPAESPLRAWLRGLVPKTRRGWVGLSAVCAFPTAVAAAIAAAIALVPALSLGSLRRWTGSWVQETASPLVVDLFGTGIPTAVRVLVDGLVGLGAVVPLGLLSLLILTSLITAPVSAWSLTRLLRPATMDEHHAH